MRIVDMQTYQMALAGIIAHARENPNSKLIIASPLKWKLWDKLFDKFKAILDVLGIKFSINKPTGTVMFDNGSEVKFVVATDEYSYKGMSPDMVYIDDVENIDERLINELKAKSKVVLMS